MEKKDKNKYFMEYRRNNLTQLSASIPKEDAKKLKNELEKDGISFSSFLKNAINEYLESKNYKNL